MYPSEEDESWRGVFVKEQVDALTQLFDMDINVCHIKGKITNNGSTLNYVKWLFILPYMAFKYKFKLVHSHHFLCALIAKLCTKCHHIYTVHEGELQTNTYKSKLIQLAVKWSDIVIYVNQEMYASSTHSEKYFIPSGVNLERFILIDRQEARMRLGLDVNKYYILFPSSPLRMEKNAKFLQSFLDNNPEFVSNRSIEVIWGGGLEYSRMYLYMNASDVLVSFSDYESDGMVFKEAMACDLPVVTFRVGNSDIYFSDGSSGSIIGRDEKQFKEQLIYWMKVGRSRGRDKLAMLEMDANTIAEKLYAVYSKLG